MVSNGFEQRHKRIKDNILWLIEKYPSIKNDYRKLVQYYWYYIDGMKNFVPLEVLETLSQPESITRAFRKLVECKEIDLPDPSRKHRTELERKHREYWPRA